MKIEDGLRREGVTIVFMDKMLAPLSRGKRREISERIVAMVDYDRSGEDRRELAQKVLYAQMRLATAGYSTGGRPPYGFRRWLVKEDGTRVRELAEGESVKMRGHHVVWLPGPEEEWGVIRRILEMLETMPASRVAKSLTEEGVPTPDHGRYRTDNGVRHRTSGVWHQSTIVNIARNPLLLTMVEYGRRSMGDQLRCTPDGPRELEDADFRPDNDKPRVIRNPDKDRITAPAAFEAPVDPERHQQLLAKLDERAGTQRGKPRSRDPDKNPLGGRAFDMNCGWPLYRQPYNQRFRYTCGLYQQSHGAQCSHNHVDGQTATQFMLSVVRQRVLLPGRLERFERRIRQLAAAEQRNNDSEQQLARLQASLARVEAEKEQVGKNLARARTDEQYRVIETEFDRLAEQAKSLRAQVAAAERQAGKTNNMEAAADEAIAIVHRLADLARDGDDLGKARQLFDLLNARLFLGFQPVQVKKRVLNKITGGQVTFGAAEPPVEIYQGPTARKKIKSPTAESTPGLRERRLPSPPKRTVCSGGEDKSLESLVTTSAHVARMF